MRAMGMPDARIEEIAARLNGAAKEKAFSDFLTKLLFEMCKLPSVPGPDLARTAREEGQVFDLISTALRERGLPGTVARVPISPEISRHRSFTFPYYAGTAEAYVGRANLLHSYTPEGTAPAGGGVALNAHIDTVAPYFTPSISGGRLFGRGADDDKGGCAAIVGALTLLRALGEETGIWPKGRITSMFVTDEETGGNGSLSLAMDAALADTYETLLVIESTEGQIHPANRGAVWYKADFPGSAANRLRLVMDVVKELERTGRELKAESLHPLFPDRPVQTCHGVLGPYGEHPSAICGKVSFMVQAPGDIEAARRALDSGLAAYVRDYGDKTAVKDPISGAPKVARHYDLESRGKASLLTVWGSTGHMGSILENDGAITKAAFMLVEAWEAIPGFDARLEPAEDPDLLVLEGGQGFLPTHGIEDVKERIARAAAKAFQGAASRYGYRGGRPVVSFNKLHNNAFDGDPDSTAVRKGLAAARLTGAPATLPIKGMKVSCDARLFAGEYPRKSVITVGPGSLVVAHSDGECMDLAELTRSCAFLALYLLLLCEPVEVV
jgi:acetylornithine deacetylase/succinyl-diaminopimelate desuccinylase-like protein